MFWKLGRVLIGLDLLLSVVSSLSKTGVISEYFSISKKIPVLHRHWKILSECESLYEPTWPWL